MTGSKSNNAVDDVVDDNNLVDHGRVRCRGERVFRIVLGFFISFAKTKIRLRFLFATDAPTAACRGSA